MVESLRVLNICRKTAVAARRVALQMIQNTIVCAPDRLQDMLRVMTRMQLVRILAAGPCRLPGRGSRLSDQPQIVGSAVISSCTTKSPTSMR